MLPKIEVKTSVATDWLSLFAVYRVVVVRDEEVVQGVLNPGVHPEDPALREALAGWGGTHFLHQTSAGVHVTLVRRRAPRPRERWWLHLLLGLATLLTTSIAGAYLAGHNPLPSRPFGPWGVPVPIAVLPGEVVPGLAFSVPLMLILLGHELGHYLTALRLKMDASPPYFIPAPTELNLIGTFGAFIRLRSAMINRVMLLDVGAAGPVVSFVLSIPAVVVGFLLSTPLGRIPGHAAGFVVAYGGQPVWLGSSLLMELLAALTGQGGGVVLLHPLAFAGWLGLFVTALNLFPLSQLDGGHILYALFGDRQRPVAWAFLAFLLGLGFLWWGWWFWTGLILLLGRASVAHPPVFDPSLPVLGWRRALGWGCLIAFFLTFTPVPFQL